MGVRAFCSGLLIALACVCTSIAQAQVSLAGFSASRGEGETVVQLDFTGPAEFQLDRFTMGEWVSIWSTELALPTGVEEIPLEFDRPGLANYVTGAAMNDNGRKGCIKLYLGSNADRIGVRLSQDGNTLRVRIPDALPAPFGGQGTAPGSFALPALPEPLSAPPAVPLAQAAELAQPVVELASAPVVEEPSTPMLEASVPADSVPATPEPALEVAPEPELTAATPAPLETVPVQPINGAFSIAREDLAPPVLPGLVAEPVAAAAVMPSVREAGPLSGRGEVNFQYLAPTGGEDKPAGDGQQDSGGGTDELEKMLDQATEAAKQQLGSTPPPPPGNKKGQQYGEGLSTPLLGVVNPYDGAAQLSAGAPVGEQKTGKAALSDITIDLFEILGTPLDQALTLLIAPTDFNVIIDASVGDNAVSLSFKNGRTDLKNALDLITKTYGLDYAVQSGTIVIASKDKLYGQLIEFEKRIFVLNYADPQSVKDILLNTAIVSENQVEVYKGETKYETVNGSTTLSSATGTGAEDVKKIETNLSTSPRNALMIKAVPEDMEKIAKVIADIDRKPVMVELEVRVCEANENGMQNLGIEYNTDAVSGTGFITQTWGEIPNATIGEGDSALGIYEDFSLGSMNRSGLNFIAKLNHEVTEGNVQILAQPNLVTMEDKQAIYFAGESVPYVKEVSRDNSGSTTFTVDYVKLGVTLNFKPRLDSDGKITIDVNPEVSSLLEFIEFPGGLQAPRSQSRQLATTVRVNDCEPFVMAGLINNTERETMRGIPFLKDLPLLGKLFRNTNKEGERTEIIITVIPKIVNN
jgi:hypothetical protein